MFEAELITVDLHDNPVYSDIEEEYISLFSCFSEKQEFEDHCISFLRALKGVGGPLKRIAEQIDNDWKVAIKTQLNIDLSL